MKNRLTMLCLPGWILLGLTVFSTSCRKDTLAETTASNDALAARTEAQASAVPATETLQTPGNGTFYIVNRRSGKLLDVYNFGTADGSNIVQWGGTGATNQQWTLNQLSGGYFSIIGVQSAKGLRVNQGSTADGAGISIAGYTGATSQQWQFIATGNGYYRIVNRNSGKDLDVNNQSIDDGANLQQWGYWGGENQQWALTTINAGGQLGWVFTTPSMPDDVRSRITAAMNGACARYNTGANWPARTLTVEYNTGVGTADANANGNIRFGPNASYQNIRTAMHEIAHTWGVGQTSGWYSNTSTGPFTGANAVSVIRTFDGPNAVINTGGGHFWPYNLNFDNEWSEANAYRHVKIVRGMRADGM